MLKILLVCNAGMSTSLMVKKMQGAAEEKGIECHIEATAQAEVSKFDGVDVILVGPQIRYQAPDIQKQVSCPVEAIDMRSYGIMDGKSVLERAIELYEENK